MGWILKPEDSMWIEMLRLEYPKKCFVNDAWTNFRYIYFIIKVIDTDANLITKWRLSSVEKIVKAKRK